MIFPSYASSRNLGTFDWKLEAVYLRLESTFVVAGTIYEVRLFWIK
jgi:hypothetical protein